MNLQSYEGLAGDAFKTARSHGGSLASSRMLECCD